MTSLMCNSVSAVTMFACCQLLYIRTRTIHNDEGREDELSSTVKSSRNRSFFSFFSSLLFSTIFAH